MVTKYSKAQLHQSQQQQSRMKVGQPANTTRIGTPADPSAAFGMHFTADISTPSLVSIPVHLFKKDSFLCNGPMSAKQPAWRRP